jgi:seryl-tRNA synthetase
MPLDINMFRVDRGGDLKVLVESQKMRYVADPEGSVQAVVDADKAWSSLEWNFNQLRKNKNLASKEIGAAKKAKKPDEEVKAIMARVAQIKDELKQVEEDRVTARAELDRLLSGFGNIVDPSVKRGRDDDDELDVVKTWGDCKVPVDEDGKEFTLLHHHELLYRIGGYEPKRGVAVAGHRAYYLRGVGVLLNQALINYGIAFLMKKEYEPLQPPFFMNKEIMAKTAQLEEFDEALYHVSTGEVKDDKYLIATSEQPISAYHQGEWLNPQDLPIRYCGVSTCFRKEAGSHGRDAWGVFRVHQFEKIEQFCLTDPEKSKDMHDEMLATAEGFYQSLGLSYHVINVLSGEINNAAAKKYDLEAWFPTLGLMRELVSSSNCTDYQSRAMEVRFGNKKMNETDKKYSHMLNATLVATERTMCAILENYQTPTGVRVPEVLVCCEMYMYVCVSMSACVCVCVSMVRLLR